MLCVGRARHASGGFTYVSPLTAPDGAGLEKRGTEEGKWPVAAELDLNPGSPSLGPYLTLPSRGNLPVIL